MNSYQHSFQQLSNVLECSKNQIIPDNVKSYSYSYHTDLYIKYKDDFKFENGKLYLPVIKINDKYYIDFLCLLVLNDNQNIFGPYYNYILSNASIQLLTEKHSQITNYVKHGSEILLNNKEPEYLLSINSIFYRIITNEITIDNISHPNSFEESLTKYIYEHIVPVIIERESEKNKSDDLKTEIDDLKTEINNLKHKLRESEIEIHYLKLNNGNKIIKYNYFEIKNRNKQLNQEFKRVYKLISKNIGFNLISL